MVKESAKRDFEIKVSTVNEGVKAGRRILPIIVIVSIIGVLFCHAIVQRKNVVDNAVQVTNQMAEYIAGNISNDIEYAKSSIKLSAISIAQTMTSSTIEDPAKVIMPMLNNTPFGGIEYIRADGMNVMNIGEPFDASDRVYYIEGIKGNTGIWNNYHPKTSNETLMNFYTPLVYNGENVGVITGYIAANTQLVPLFETSLYGQDIYGLLVDENNMVICSTMESEYVKDMTLDMYVNQFNITDSQKQQLYGIIDGATVAATSYRLQNKGGRVCAAVIPDTKWKVVIIVPETSVNAIIWDDTRDSVITTSIIGLILVLYATYVLIRNVKRRREIAKENARLEVENRNYNEENQRAFAEISEIRDIIASAEMGTWRIELTDEGEPKMFVDDTMKMLLGINDMNLTPEKTYTEWFNNITEDAVESVLNSVERMEQGRFDENTYLWKHPKKGIRYVRCGGTAVKIPGGFSLRGYHYDVDDVVREDQAKVVMLKEALSEKKEYYSTLDSLGDIFYSMHVIDLKDDTVVEFNSRDQVKEIVNHKNGAVEMMVRIISVTTAAFDRERALEFTDLTTVSERMKDKKIISEEFVGVHTGWFLASFVAMDTDDEGRPAKVIFTTRVIDKEKKQQETLIKKASTDELTGLLNRRAYEEDIYAHNDIPEEDKFIYISLDVNGLKVVNDTKGHMAGDELIIGACQCMKKSLGAYGKLYRIGGDEFVAILFCDDNEIIDILEDFDATIASWKGKLIDGLSISYGFINKYENPELSVRQLGAVAEQRMYEAKSDHYKKTGVDRRGQQDAHKALCELYTKILKINITEDSYNIINMDISEQSEEKGFSAKISDWLTAFGTTGHVHPDDLQSYLEATSLKNMRDYFASDKTSLHIFYRRRYADSFKQAMMEIIPASDYTNDNQSLFLYVKEIDK